MADTQIRGLGESSAPLIYTVPGAQEILLKSLFASFDGAATASAWYPCVRVRAPGGGIVGEYITQATVAAGGSADVSFGPFLRGATASATPAASGVPFAQASDFSTTLTSGATVTMNLADWFGTTDSSLFSTRVVGGKTYLNCITSGMYAVRMSMIAQHPTVTGALTIIPFFDVGAAGVDTSEFDAGTLIALPVTFGGANRWQVVADTYFGVRAPGGVAFTAKINCVALSANVTNQHTDLIIERRGDYVANVLI